MQLIYQTSPGQAIFLELVCIAPLPLLNMLSEVPPVSIRPRISAKNVSDTSTVVADLMLELVFVFGDEKNTVWS